MTHALHAKLTREQHYNHIANQNKAENQAAYADWVQSYTPEQIRQANAARTVLKRKVSTDKSRKATGRGLSPIKDDRQIKRPNSPYLKFNIDRQNSGDFKGMPVAKASQLITQEWNALSAGEKKVCFSDLSEERQLQQC